MASTTHLSSTPFKRDLITLSHQAPLAEGGGRRIYMHPNREDAVIKLHKEFKPKPFLWVHNLFRQKRRRFGSLMHSFVEIDEVTAAVGRTGQVPEFATQFLGFVQTDLGTGAVFEAIKSSDGKLAMHLFDHAKSHSHETEMANAIDALWDAVIATRVVVSDPGLKNIIVTGTADTGYHLVLVDGLGERTLIPIQTWSAKAHLTACTKNRIAMQQAYADLCNQP